MTQPDKPPVPDSPFADWPRMAVDTSDGSPLDRLLRTAGHAASRWTLGPDGPYRRTMTGAEAHEGHLREGLLHLLELGLLDIDTERLDAAKGLPCQRATTPAPAAAARPDGAAAKAVSTPCSVPNSCDPDGELCDRHETEKAHSEGEHAYCDVSCEVEFPTEILRNTVIVRGIPGTAGMLDELLRRAAARPDDTTGAPASCWCGHPEDRHYTGNTRMTFSDGCKDCRGWDGAHAYGQEPPWDRNANDTDDTTGA